MVSGLCAETPLASARSGPELRAELPVTLPRRRSRAWAGRNRQIPTSRMRIEIGRSLAKGIFAREKRPKKIPARHLRIGPWGRVIPNVNPRINFGRFLDGQPPLARDRPILIRVRDLGTMRAPPESPEREKSRRPAGSRLEPRIRPSPSSSEQSHAPSLSSRPMCPPGHGRALCPHVWPHDAGSAPRPSSRVSAPVHPQARGPRRRGHGRRVSARPTLRP